MLLNYHIGRSVFGSMCFGDLVRLGLSSIRVAGCQHVSDINISIIIMDILMSETC